MKNSLKNKKVSFLGVTFKAGTDDMRESSVLTLMPSLLKLGAKVFYYDPTGKKDELKNKKIFFRSSIKDVCLDADLLIIHTEWNEFKQLNFKRLVNKKNFKIFDLRNLYSLERMKKNNLRYFSIGR